MRALEYPKLNQAFRFRHFHEYEGARDTIYIGHNFTVLFRCHSIAVFHRDPDDSSNQIIAGFSSIDATAVFSRFKLSQSGGLHIKGILEVKNANKNITSVPIYSDREFVQKLTTWITDIRDINKINHIITHIEPREGLSFAPSDRVYRATDALDSLLYSPYNIVTYSLSDPENYFKDMNWYTLHYLGAY